MPETIGVECPYCLRTIEGELETAYILIPRLDAIRFNLIQTQTILARIESQATLYQPGLRRLCGEATFLLAENVSAVRATIEEARHQRLQRRVSDLPAWW